MFGRLSEQRFTLRMLHPNEYYFDDYAVSYFSDGIHQQIVNKGTLKICSKTIVFVPSSLSSPIIKISQKYVKSISLFNANDADLLKNNKVNSVKYHFNSSKISYE